MEIALSSQIAATLLGNFSIDPRLVIWILGLLRLLQKANWNLPLIMQKGLGEKLLGPPTWHTTHLECVRECVSLCVCAGLAAVRGCTFAVCTCVRAILNISNICNICRCRHSSNQKYTTHSGPGQPSTGLHPPVEPFAPAHNFGLAIYRTPKTSTAKVNAYFLVRQPPADVDVTITTCKNAAS